MDYYSTLRKDYICKEMYPTDHRVDYFPKGPFTGSSVKITPKANCVPRFVSQIEGNAVEEGERVFFEGIVDAQPQPIFSWYFNDEPIDPGSPGWEDAEVHDSKKMSTLILQYAREHHMGKYTLVAQNRMGHNVCNCDLIVRKKQFPPVFWQRLYNYEATSGSKLVAEVEVGGWPIPTLVWYKDDEPVLTLNHTENYNGYPNKYVPERKVEVRQIDPIRHCIIFHRISEADAGLYTVVATNPLGEAVCQAQFVIEPGEGGGNDLYLPELWKNGKRLTWADEDRRVKKFVGFQEPELSDDDIAAMTARVSGVPLPRAIEYLASLPNYYPVPIEGLLDMKYKPGSFDGPNADKREGKRGGKPSKPSKFVRGKIVHSGYVSDDVGGFSPMWFSDIDPNFKDPRNMAYRPIKPNLTPPKPRPERAKSPPCPHVWESHDSIDSLYKMLDTVGCRILSGVNLSQSGGSKQGVQLPPAEHKSFLNKVPEPRKQIIHYETKKPDESIKAKQVQKFSYTNPSKNIEKQRQEIVHSNSFDHQVDLETSELTEMPPALPPKTKIMFSPSRHLFSPTEDSLDGSSIDLIQDIDYIPVKEKVKMIAQQQEEIFRREEIVRQKSGGCVEITPPTGGVRILPPSPVTVRRVAEVDEAHEVFHHTTEQKFVKMEKSFSQQSQVVVTNAVEVQVDSQSHQRQQLQIEQQELYLKQQHEEHLKRQQEEHLKRQQEEHLKRQEEHLMRQQEEHLKRQQEEHLKRQQEELLRRQQEEFLRQQQEEFLREQKEQFLKEQRELHRQQEDQQELLLTQQHQLRQSEQEDEEEITYVSQTKQESKFNVASMQQSIVSNQILDGVMIPRLEDKYGIDAHLDELQSTIGSEESFNLSQTTTGVSTVQSSSVSQSSQRMSGYSTLSQDSAVSSSTVRQSEQSFASVQSCKTIQDSSYSTASFSSSQQKQETLSKETRGDFNEAGSSVARFGRPGKNIERPLTSSINSASCSSPPVSSPRVNRKPRVDQSPRRQDNNDSPKYRTPPSTPFQPGFYKKPHEDDQKANPFPLPSPSVKRAKPRVRYDLSDSEDENNEK